MIFKLSLALFLLSLLMRIHRDSRLYPHADKVGILAFWLFLASGFVAMWGGMP